MSETPVPPSFEAAKRVRLFETQQALVAALKLNQFERALEHARTVLALDPKNAVALQFVPLLEEKLSLESDSEEDSNETTTAVGKDGPISGGEEEDDSEGSDSDSDDDSSDETEDDDSAHDGTSSSGQYLAADAQDSALGQGMNALSLGSASAVQHVNPFMSREQRRALHKSLADGVKLLKDAETVRKLQTSDPLLQ